MKMNYLTEQFIGEQVDCEEFGLGTVVEIKENTVVVALEYGLAEIDIEDLELTEEAEQIDEVGDTARGRKVLASYVKAASADATTSAARAGSLHRAKKDTSMLKRMKGIEQATDRLTKEEVELDEAHMGGYKADSEKSKFNSGHRAKLMNPEGRVSYLSGKSYKTPAHAKAAAKFYGSIMHLPTEKMDSKMSNYNKAYDAKHGDVKESVELDEARGRPPKAPKEGQKASPAWLRHLERQEKGEDKEEVPALGFQLRKAVSIGKEITFMNGEKKKVDPRHISLYDDHIAARKTTQDKDRFQTGAAESHDDFVKAVTAPVPKPHGGTSEIVKYR
jgi:hypothetical protein